jgi:hypothetical protein
MDLLLKNLRRLKDLDIGTAARVHGAVVPTRAELLKAGSDDWTLRVSDLSFHSRVDPKAEAESRAEAADMKALRERGGTPAVFGLGLGYHVLAMAQRFDKVLVIEPDPGMIRLAFGLIDFTEVLPKLVFLWPNSHPDLYVGATIVPHPPSARLHAVELDWWRERVASETASEANRAIPASELSKLWRGIEGLDDFMTGRTGNQENSEVVEAARRGRGPLTELEIYLLLIAETAGRTGRPAHKEA